MVSFKKLRELTPEERDARRKWLDEKLEAVRAEEQRKIDQLSDLLNHDELSGWDEKFASSVIAEYNPEVFRFLTTRQWAQIDRIVMENYGEQ